MSKNLENREREGKRKRENRRQTNEDQREKERQRARARDKNKRDTFVGRKTWTICSGEKMRNTSGHQGENQRQWKKKVNKKTYDISSVKRVTRTFLEVSRCSRAKQRQRNVQKKYLAWAKFFFLLIRPIVVFSPFSLPSRPLSITWFYSLFEQTTKIIESFAFSPGWLNATILDV